MMKHGLAIALLSLLATAAQGADQGNEDETRFPDLGDMRLSGQVQLWNVFTSGATDAAGEPVEDRWDMYVRRARLGVKGTIGDSIDYTVSFAYDNIGKNEYTASSGTPQNRDNAEFKVWDAFFTWSANPTWANVTMGYFRPQVGRESITSAVQVNSFTKALPNVFPRLHLVDSGPGRETGVNVGGRYHPGGWGLQYNVGIFDADHEPFDGQPAGSAWSPLLAARVSLTLGAPEMDRYGLGYRVNYFGARNGTTISLNYARQGETDEFRWNGLTGIDLLANYGPWSISAEYDLMERETGALSYENRVSFARCGYNVPRTNGQILEPFAMYTEFRADDEAPETLVGFWKVWQAGLNWYIDRNRIKLNLAYSRQDSDLGAGDFAGFGVQFLY